MNKHLIRLLRPQQWLKNAFVLTPLFFDRHVADWHYAWPCIQACMAFCLTASGIYCFNDIHDAEADRQHPVKRLRPVACGAVSRRAAYAVMTAAWALAFILIALGNFASPRGVAAMMLLYVVMNVAYCVRLKQIAILDVFIIAAGFVLRIVVGGLAAGIVLSHWIILTTFLLALFLALAKRRDDVVIRATLGAEPRRGVERYCSNQGASADFLGSAISVLGSVTIMCYILYTVSGEVVKRIGCDYLYATSAFVLAGMLRYMQLTLVEQKSGSPTQVVLHDRFIQVCIFGWIAMFSIMLYG